MAKKVVGSILHGAYGDLYEQALCLKHYAAAHPEIDLKLFAVTPTRLEAFRMLDLSFASSFELWPAIEKHPEIDRFHQFQVFDGELRNDVLDKLSPAMLERIDRTRNLLPWTYLRTHGLIPAPAQYQLGLSETGTRELDRIAAVNGISGETLSGRPTISFLWRYRKPGLGSISKLGQKSEQELVRSYSSAFQTLIARFDCHVLVCGMNLVTDESTRVLTDDKYPSFGLDLPADRVTYMKGLSWTLELELASRATVCCGNASGFTEGLWLKRGRDMVLMDAPPHYLAKAIYHRMPLFHLTRPHTLAGAFLFHSSRHYVRSLAAILQRSGYRKN